MEESAVADTNTTTLTKRMRASTADLTAVPLLQAMLDQLRGDLATARVALDSERSAVRALKRDRAAEIKSVREEEARKCRDALSDLKSRLERDHEDALQRQKDAITKKLNAEMLRALKAKDSEVRQELTQAHAREETLKLQVRDAVRTSCDSRSQQQAIANSSAEIHKLQQEISTLRTQNKQLEERLQVVIAADRQKAVDLRSQHEEHELELSSIKKHSQQETHRLLEELKSKDRLISQLQKQLSLQTGLVEEQRGRLLESLEVRKSNTMDKKTASPKLKTQRQSGEDSEPLSENEEFHEKCYSRLLNDHKELLCDHQPLNAKMKKEMAQRILLEHELAATRTKVRELKRKLAEQKGGSALMAERIATLQAEAHELREQNELLEFRILELEECHENASMKNLSPDTRTDTESDSGILSLPNSDDVTSDTDLGIYDVNLGRIFPESTINNTEYSKISNRIVAKVLPFTDLSIDKTNDLEEKTADGYNTLKKKLKNTECLQESGIFEETEFDTQSTQTDDILELVDQTRVSEFMLENGVVGDLSAEIKKLTQFRELVEERGSCCDHKRLLCVNEGKGDIPQSRCASHIKEIQYYRERLQILEDKIIVYESSGDTQTQLLANRLQKEVTLSAQVKDLTARVHHLTLLNRHLEEEKCEFEEAENDTRLKCQKLEVKIVALNEKKSELQAQLQQERRNMSRLRTSLSESERKRQETKGQLNYIETVLNKYEHRNYELEEHEVELRHRLEMLETTIPTLMMWNTWRVIQDPSVSRSAVTNAISNNAIKRKSQGTISPSKQSDHVYKYRPMTSPELTTSMVPVCSSKEMDIRVEDELMKLKELEEDRNRILYEKREAEEKWNITEKHLKERLQSLESKEALLAAELQNYKEAEEHYKERIQRLENELYSKKHDSGPTTKEEFPLTSDEITKTGLEDVTSVASIGCESLECIKKIQELVQTEVEMKRHINELELKEKAYMETLLQADELWSDMENSYKSRLAKAEDSEASLRDKVKKLEESETKVRQTYRFEEENYMLMEKIQNFEQNEKEFKERIHALETEKNKLVKETTQLRDALVMVQSELKKTKELVEGPLKEELAKEKKLSKILQEEIKTIENEMKEASSAHETQINGLKAQLTKTSRELVDMECTNGELKEEVETLESKVCELKSSLEFQKTSEEKMLIQMSQTILEKEKELEAAKQEIQYAKTPSAHEELKEALPELQKREIITKSFPEKPESQTDSTSPDAQVTLKVSSAQESYRTFQFPTVFSLISLEGEVVCKCCLKPHEGSPLVCPFLEKQVASYDQSKASAQEMATSREGVEAVVTSGMVGKDEESAALLQQLEELLREKNKLQEHVNELEQLVKMKSNEMIQTKNMMLELEKRLEAKEVDMIYSPGKMAEESVSVHNTVSELQTILGTLQHKCRLKDQMITALANDLRERATSGVFDGLINSVVAEEPARDFDKEQLYDYLNSTEVSPKQPTPSRQEIVLTVKPKFAPKKQIEAENTVALPSSSRQSLRNARSSTSMREVSTMDLKVLRQIGPDSILLGWNIPPNGSFIGFEIYVNGALAHKVRSPSRNKALLQSLDLKSKVVVTMFALTPQGRASEPAANLTI